MRHRRLGRTNFLVSEISLGTVEIGMDYGIRPAGRDARPDLAQAARLLHRALDLGINYIDTARAYGEAESVIGSVLKLRRSEFFLASKALPYDREGLSGFTLRERITSSVRESLRALQTDVIDLMMIHSAPAAALFPDAVLDIFEELRRSGLIRFVGASVYGEEAAVAAIGSGRCDCVQIAYSLLDRRPEAAALQAAAQNDVGVVVRSVLLKGALSHRYQHLPPGAETLKSAVRQLEQVAVDNSAGGLPELAYRYVLANPLVHTALVGTGRIDEMEAAIRYAELGPPQPGVIDQIRRVSLEDAALLNPANWPL